MDWEKFKKYIEEELVSRVDFDIQSHPHFESLQRSPATPLTGFSKLSQPLSFDYHSPGETHHGAQR